MSYPEPYLTLYNSSAAAIKAVSPRLRVGGVRARSTSATTNKHTANTKHFSTAQVCLQPAPRAAAAPGAAATLRSTLTHSRRDTGG